MIALIVALVVLLIGGVGIGVWLLTGDSEPELARDELFLEPAMDPGPDAFTSSVATQPLTSIRPLPVQHAPRPPEPTDQGADGLGVTRVTGVDATRPGLYGGTRDDASCDVEQLINFLQQNPDKAQAFADVQGIDPQTLPDYLRRLTPMVLRVDTLVINHGFRDGRATPRQAVLQAGTAVLVDEFGIPRVRCSCGNPLLPPVAPTANPVITGTRWADFELTQIISIVNQQNITINEFIVVDLETEEPFKRLPGYPPNDDDATELDELCAFEPDLCIIDDPGPDNGTDNGFQIPDDVVVGTGDVQVTLIWNGDADLDLHLIDPDGVEIYFGNRNSPSGGELDVDEIPGCGNRDTWVENIFWPTGQAPPGRYEAWVDVWNPCDGDSSFQLEVRVDGQLIDTLTGTANVERSPSIEFFVN